MATVHIIGAGMAGLGAAVALTQAGRAVAVWEAAPRAGGRCRSYHDTRLGCVIDNGNHLVLSGNTAVQSYLAAIGAADRLVGPAAACVPFRDDRNGRRWAVRPNCGRVPWWLLVPNRAVPGFGLRDLRAAMRLLHAGPDATLGQILPAGRSYAAFWEPLVLAVMNAPVAEAAARPMARVVRETFGRGGAACRPLVARRSLADTFVNPAVDWLQTHGARVSTGRRLRGVERDPDGRVRTLRLDGADPVTLGTDDRVILAVPPAAARDLAPELAVPEDDAPIVNVHFRFDRPLPLPCPDVPLIGLVGTTAQWAFVRDDLISVTVSAADALVDAAADRIVACIWPEIARAFTLDPTETPPVRVVKERRATFRQTPANQYRRPAWDTLGRHLLLAGDWTDTGLPATIEGSLRSGKQAAAMVSTGG